MTENLDELILDLLEWLDGNPRPYAEVLDAWRTSCPRLPVWEEANERGFIARQHEPGRGRFVSVSDSGSDYLRNCRSPVTSGPEPGSSPHWTGTVVL
jgi:hypothetical protein